MHVKHKEADEAGGAEDYDVVVVDVVVVVVVVEVVGTPETEPTGMVVPPVA